MLGIKPYKTEAVGKRFASKAGSQRNTTGSRSIADSQGKMGAYTTDRGLTSAAGVNHATGKYLGGASRSSGKMGGTDEAGPYTSPRNKPNVAGVNQFPGLKAKGNKSASVGAVNMRGEKRDPARQGYGLGSKKNESTKHSSAFGGAVKIANSGMTAADFARGYKSLGSMRDAMNSSQGGARGK
jgi:hypothetical protein